MKLYADSSSGNCYKVQLLLSFLGLPYDLVEVNVLSGDTRKPGFLAKNPNGRIPLLELDDGSLLPESNAILFYLAEGTPFLPEDRLGRARALQWMFFEQYSHEPYIAVLRFWRKYQGRTRESEPGWAEREEKGYAALDVMERALMERPWFVAESPSIADIALYAYTHVAAHGDFDLSCYGAINGWLDRLAALPGYIAIAPPPGRA
ncbi:glutathione S-transferase family protein [Pelagibius litoralis]|uniref:Glutathione S-transferase family protein n=1 Tax=Pelagibius litoralis TaxID=374515 RepID=A0A967F342_9PROT|nr:glutathione S-transferase family protein [Pelagibius litoralis]NIA72128.1 glutathione S-transferase family protein [Pelagibius litoralis]